MLSETSAPIIGRSGRPEKCKTCLGHGFAEARRQSADLEWPKPIAEKEHPAQTALACRQPGRPRRIRQAENPVSGRDGARGLFGRRLTRAQ